MTENLLEKAVALVKSDNRWPDFIDEDFPNGEEISPEVEWDEDLNAYVLILPTWCGDLHHYHILAKELE